ncbi:MAG: phospholipase A [Acidovorax sp.]
MKRLALLAGLCAAAGAQAQTAGAALQQCAATADNAARLACYDQLASQQAWSAPPASAQAATPAAAPAPALPPEQTAPVELARIDGCRDPQFSAISRFWELSNDTDCGTFSFRSYRPMTVAVVAGSSVNDQPSSPSAGHTPASPVDYRKQEMRIQLSLRTKLAQGLLTDANGTRKDSIWFGYTQQSYWQLFSPGISRPFRATDHEPEVMYVYPTDAHLPFGWRWRYSGVGLVHQSNGQSLPLSRSWNRWYLMTGMELGSQWQVHARAWKRIQESAANDDNPDITDYMGRGELRVVWTPSDQNTFSATLRSSFGHTGRASARLEWMTPLGKGLGGAKSNLRLHTALFSGYGENMTDYNYKRTTFSIGLSLVDF